MANGVVICVLIAVSANPEEGPLMRIRSALRAARDALRPRSPKTWQHSQQYELHHAKIYMQQSQFKEELERLRLGPTDMPDELRLKEFFSSDLEKWDEFKVAATGKIGIDIGPCIFSPLSYWAFLKRRIAIEPLGEQAKEYQHQHFGISFFDNMELRACGADVFMPDLESAVDGVIYCRNMLDHTPNWPLVLSNIGLYAAPGCHLLFWADYNHHGTTDDGHYEICSTADEMKRLVRSIGFDVKREYNDPARQESNWGCFAIKR